MGSTVADGKVGRASRNRNRAVGPGECLAGEEVVDEVLAGGLLHVARGLLGCHVVLEVIRLAAPGERQHILRGGCTLQEGGIATVDGGELCHVHLLVALGRGGHGPSRQALGQCEVGTRKVAEGGVAVGIGGDGALTGAVGGGHVASGIERELAIRVHVESTGSRSVVVQFLRRIACELQFPGNLSVEDKLGCLGGFGCGAGYAHHHAEAARIEDVGSDGQRALFRGIVCIGNIGRRPAVCTAIIGCQYAAHADLCAIGKGDAADSGRLRQEFTRVHSIGVQVKVVLNRCIGDEVAGVGIEVPSLCLAHKFIGAEVAVVHLGVGYIEFVARDDTLIHHAIVEPLAEEFGRGGIEVLGVAKHGEVSQVDDMEVGVFILQLEESLLHSRAVER